MVGLKFKDVEAIDYVEVGDFHSIGVDKVLVDGEEVKEVTVANIKEGYVIAYCNGLIHKDAFVMKRIYGKVTIVWKKEFLV